MINLIITTGVCTTLLIFYLYFKYEYKKEKIIEEEKRQKFFNHIQEGLSNVNLKLINFDKDNQDNIYNFSEVIKNINISNDIRVKILN